MNHLDHLQYLADKFEIMKFLAGMRQHGTIEQDAKRVSGMFGRSYQTCKRIVKHCVRMQWWKPADPIGDAIIGLWSMKKKVGIPLLKMSTYYPRFHRRVYHIKPIKIEEDSHKWTYYLPDI